MVSAAAASTKRGAGCQATCAMIRTLAPVPAGTWRRGRAVRGATRGQCQGCEEEDLHRAAERAQEAGAGLRDRDFGRGGRAEAQRRASEGQVEEGLVALAADRDAQQMDVVGHGDGGEGALHFHRVHRRGELVVGGAEVSVAGGIGVALAGRSARAPAKRMCSSRTRSGCGTCAISYSGMRNS